MCGFGTSLHERDIFMAIAVGKNTGQVMQFSHGNRRAYEVTVQ